MQITDFSYIEKYISENRRIIIFSFLIAVICYGYEIFNFTMSIDEECASFFHVSENRFLIEIGRWGTYFLNNLLYSHTILPYAPFLLGVLCLAAASILYVCSLEGGFGSKAVFSVVFISSPLHSYYLAFNTADPYFSFGLLLMVTSYLEAVRGFEKKNKTALLISVVLFAFSISIYQALFSVFLTMMVFHLLTKKIGNPEISLKDILKRAGSFILLATVAMALYKLTDILIYYLVLGSSAQDGQDYLKHMQGWGKIPPLKTMYYLTTKTLAFFAGRIIPGEKFIIPLSVLTLTTFLIYRFISVKRGFINRMILISLLLILLFCPFILMYINGEVLPARTMMAFPLLLAMLWWLVYRQLNLSGRKILLILAFALFITNTGITTRLFYSSWVSWQADRDMANRIYDRICNLDLPDNGQPVKVAFIGKYDREENNLFLKSDIFGASFFAWDDGNPVRMLFFFKTIGINNISLFPKEKIKANFADTIPKLPCWPYKGSVCLYKNVVIVKLSNEPK